MPLRHAAAHCTRTIPPVGGKTNALSRIHKWVRPTRALTTNQGDMLTTPCDNHPARKDSPVKDASILGDTIAAMIGQTKKMRTMSPHLPHQVLSGRMCHVVALFVMPAVFTSYYNCPRPTLWVATWNGVTDQNISQVWYTRYQSEFCRGTSALEKPPGRVFDSSRKMA
jgi:hypothetical protein